MEDLPCLYDLPSFQSLCLAVQVGGARHDSLVVREVIFLKVWFNFRMISLELSNDFSRPQTIL